MICKSRKLGLLTMMVSFVFCMTFLVSGASAYHLGTSDTQSNNIATTISNLPSSIENKINHIDSKSIPGDDYVKLEAQTIPGTSYVYQKEHTYKQITRHIYYSDASDYHPRILIR